MREIKFRGKRVDNGEWVYGSLFKYKESCFILTNKSTKEHGSGYIADGSQIRIESYFEVNPETVGQFTGLKDKNGKEIYGGDIGKTNGWITEVRWNGKNCYYYVEYSKEQFGNNYRKLLHECYLTTKPYVIDFEVIGNTTDNPELIKEV